MKVLLATDGSQWADAALEVILWRPWAPGTQVSVISVVEPLHEKVDKIFQLFGLGETALTAQKQFRQQTEKILERYGDKLCAKFGKENVRVDILEGDARKIICRTASSQGSDIIVIGPHGLKNAPDFLLGPVAEYLLGHAPCSVEILKQANLSTMIGELEHKQPVEEDKYLIAVDGSQQSQALLDTVMARTWPPHSFFKLVTVIEPLAVGYSGLGPWESSQHVSDLSERVRQAQRDEAVQMVEAMAEKLTASLPDAEVNGQVLEGDPRTQILEAARSWPCDLIIMGSHGHRGVPDSLLGSVSRAVAGLAPCSVLINKAPQSAADSESV